MKRRSIKILINEKFYIFSERNREDMDFIFIADRIKQRNLQIIQESVKNGDERLVLMTAEMRRTPTADEIERALLTDAEILRKQSWDSFKIANEGFEYKEYKELVKDRDLSVICRLINELENEGEKKKTPKGVMKSARILPKRFFATPTQE